MAPPQLRCTICNGKSIKLDDLTKHISERHPRAVRCSYCTFVARTDADLDEHVLVHFPARRQFPCLIERRCPSFTTEDRLIEHLVKAHPEFTMEKARALCKLPPL